MGLFRKLCAGKKKVNFYSLTYFRYLLVALEGLDDPAVGGAEAELVDPVGKVVVLLAHEGREVRVAPHQGHGLARRHVEVPGDLVEVQGAVDAARVVGVVRPSPPVGKTRKRFENDAKVGSCATNFV